MSFTHFYLLLLSELAAGSSAGILPILLLFFSPLLLLSFDGMNLKWNGYHGKYGNKTRTPNDWEYGKIDGYGWKRGQRLSYHTHPVMIATLNCYYYLLRRAKSMEREGIRSGNRGLRK